jgi:lipopolysaccharide/colanic/teichoic acid biosynthesis glycosyltransferase
MMGLTSLLDTTQLNTTQNHYALTWRQGTLLVRGVADNETGMIMQSQSPSRVVDCLRRSRVKRVKLDLQLSLADLTFWADASQAAGKPVYISLPSAPDLPPKYKPFQWHVKRFFDPIVGLLILALIAPLCLLLAIVIRQENPGSDLLRQQWQVGARGQLFKTHYFQLHDRSGKIRPSLAWIDRYHLDRLPKLWSVVRGQMSLVGACPRKLADVVELEPHFRDRLNALPGITGAWHLTRNWKLYDLDVLWRVDFDYLWHWSLLRDMQVITQTLAKVVWEEDLSEVDI